MEQGLTVLQACDSPSLQSLLFSSLIQSASNLLQFKIRQQEEALDSTKENIRSRETANFGPMSRLISTNFDHLSKVEQNRSNY
jgi:hypothetical protein